MYNPLASVSANLTNGLSSKEVVSVTPSLATSTLNFSSVINSINFDRYKSTTSAVAFGSVSPNSG